MLASFEDPFESPTDAMTSLSPPPRRGSKRVSTPDKEKLEDDVLRSPHNVPSFMDMRVGRDGHSDVSSSGDGGVDVVHEDHDDYVDDEDDDDAYVPAKFDDDPPHEHEGSGDGKRPLIQVHEVEEDDRPDPDFSPQSPSSPLTDETTGFTLSPPSRPHRLGDTSDTGSVISLVDVSI